MLLCLDKFQEFLDRFEIFIKAVFVITKLYASLYLFNWILNLRNHRAKDIQNLGIVLLIMGV